MTPAQKGVLTVENVTKSYAGVQALKDVSLDIQPGEVLGLIGANGAGKSTLVKILAGATRPDSGRITLADEELDFKNPREALEAGIALNPQEIVLVERQSVADNLTLGDPPSRLGLVRGKKLRRRATELLEEVGLSGKISPEQPASSLTAVEARLVSVAEALSRHPRILILDEPSAALPTETAKTLEPIIRQVAERGASVVLISHRLGEIRRLCDRVVAMRDGRVTGVLSHEEATEERMVELLGGTAEIEGTGDADAIEVGEESLLSVRNLSGIKVQDVSLEVRPGEIVGIGGLYGSGRSELLRLIAGAQKSTAGEIEVAGSSPGSPRQARELGIGYVPESRGQMLFSELSIGVNATIALLRKINPLLVFRRRERKMVNEISDGIELSCNPADPVRTLSGGNQQKVCLARWLLRDAQLYLLDEPSAGIDVHARAEIHNLLRRLARDEGRAVLMASGEPEELVQVCDRVIVMSEGRLVRELKAPFNTDRLVAASYAAAV